MTDTDVLSAIDAGPMKKFWRMWRRNERLKADAAALRLEFVANLAEAEAAGDAERAAALASLLGRWS